MKCIENVFDFEIETFLFFGVDTSKSEMCLMKIIIISLWYHDDLISLIIWHNFSKLFNQKALSFVSTDSGHSFRPSTYGSMVSINTHKYIFHINRRVWREIFNLFWFTGYKQGVWFTGFR